MPDPNDVPTLETPASEAAAGGNAEHTPDETALESETGDEGEQGKQPHKQGGFQKRIAKLSTKLSTAQAEAEYWREQALRTPKADPDKKAVVAEDDPEPDPEKFNTTLDYLKAARAWDKRQAVKEAETNVLKKIDEREKQASQKSDQQKQADTWEQKKNAAREKYDDFDDALDADVRITPAIGKVLLKSPDGADLAYYLGTHPEEAQAIARMDEMDTAIALGKISATLAKEEPEAEPEEDAPPPPKQAPKPPTPTKKVSSVKAVSIYDEKLPFAEYVKLRNAGKTS